jgi:hypothetical protein
VDTRQINRLRCRGDGESQVIYGLTNAREMHPLTILGGIFLVYGLFNLLWSRSIAVGDREMRKSFYCFLNQTCVRMATDRKDT